ncbi:NGG1p interacting factor NIF3 [Sulfurimonas sp.]
MYKLIYYVPKEYKETTKEALFKLGAGKFSNYDKCSFETLGFGQFRALNGATPYIGSINELEILQEYKVEMICQEALIKEAVQVLKDTHPYEEVAYEVLKLEDF